MIIYFFLFNILPSSKCGIKTYKYPHAPSCVCLGIKQIMDDDSYKCLGKRIKCYDLYFLTQKEIPCK